MPDFEADNILSESVAEYLGDVAGEPPEPAREMEDEARRRDFPIVGPQVGRLLDLMAQAIRPPPLVELGSGFGYSAFWFGRSLTGADIHLSDYRPENLRQARGYLSKIEKQNNFHYHEGDALELLDTVDGTIDLLFVDIDKEDYPEALDRSEDRLDEGCWLIADNVLWRGTVARSDVTDETTRALRRFNRQLNGPRWRTSIIPIRDGLALARRTNQ